MDQERNLKTVWAASSGNPELRNQIERKFAEMAADNKRYAREDLFYFSHILKKSFSVEFMPATESFDRYGDSVTLRLLLNDEEFAELHGNYRAEPTVKTYGTLRATCSANPMISADQIKELEEIGFNTSDILTIYYI